MYIFFSSSNTWSNVCVIYSCDIFMWYLQLWYHDICRHNIYKCSSKPTPDREMWFSNDCGRRSIYKFNNMSVIALWRKICFCLPKKTKTYSPKDHLSNHQKFFWALITICMFDQVFEASYLQPIVLVQISHFIHKAVLITLTRQFNNILVIFFKSTRMISLSPIISIVTQQNL